MSQENQVKCDVVVIGAGPGGSTAAYWLARSGADVLLVDKVHFPREKPCGDGLTPSAVKLLEEMGLADFIYTRGQAFSNVSIAYLDACKTSYSLYANVNNLPRRGLVIPRRKLDQALCLQAIHAGAHFLPGFSILKLHWYKDHGMDLIGHSSMHYITIETRLVIIATGASRILAQNLGVMDKVPPTALAMRGYITGLTRLDESLEIYLDRELFPGYAWIFPAGEETANVGVGIMLNRRSSVEASQKLRSAFNRLIHSHQLDGGHLLGQPQGYPIRTDFPTFPVHADSILVVGEAAGLVDPLTGEGIALALESGKLAAEVAIKALFTGDLSSQQLSVYTDLLLKKHANYFQSAHELMVRLDDPIVVDNLIRFSHSYEYVQEALNLAIVKEQPRDSIVLLGEVLRSKKGSILARAVFTLNTYRPLLDRCREYMLEQVHKDAPSPVVIEMVSRGKMLRALLVFLGCQVVGGDTNQVLPAAAGIELAHAASLIHDDIMDDARFRRGLPVIHTILGEARAVVCGDYLIAKAFRLLAESRTKNPEANVVEAFIIGAESSIRACTGQFFDVGVWTKENLTEEFYLEMVANKTAAAIAGALKAGAVLVGGSPSLLEQLSYYGEKVGIGFQIKDDLLDWYDFTNNGCSIDRRVSLPLIHAFWNSRDCDREIISRFLNKEIVEIKEIFDLLKKTGSLAYAERIAHLQVNEAISFVNSIPHMQNVLEDFALYAIIRNQ